MDSFLCIVFLFATTTSSSSQLIVCLSARRAVSILKELAVLKVRVGKFFPKNGSVSEQRNLLASTPLGLAVGTPHRLHQLLCPPSSSCSTPSHAKSSPNKQHQQQKLSLGQTRLVIFDCHVSHKQYTVCTLPDTAPHCMALVRDGLGPQWSKSRNSKNNREDCCRVAFA